MAEMVLAVPGMKCDHCVRAVSAAVRDVTGVKTVTVDPSARTVRVTGTAVSPEVRAAIVAAGYAVGA